MMYQKQSIGWIYLSILTSSAILPILCYPSHDGSATQIQPHIILPEGRKFAEKQNPTKKVGVTPAPLDNLQDVNDIQTNQIPDAGGFSWSNVLTSLMQMLFNPVGATGPSKSDSLDADQTNIQQSPWTTFLTMGLKLLTSFLGGGRVAGMDGIDKIDNSSPMQGILTAVFNVVLGPKNGDQAESVAKQAGEFINIVVALLDALKTSFSHRSMTARSLGKKDSISDATIAGLTYFKGYVRTMKTSDDNCTQRIICETSKECTDSLNQPNSIYCQLGTYATSTLLQKTSAVPYESLREASRRGRSVASAEECKQFYSICNDN